MKYHVIGFAVLLIIITLLGTGCDAHSFGNSSSSNDDGITESLSEIQVNSPMPYEFSQNQKYVPVNYPQQKAMWFAFMDYEDILKGKSEDEFRKEILIRFGNAKNLGINTLYVQVRAFCDAYYQSEIFPKGEYYDEDADYDPLSIMVEIAHGLGLSIHAWVNPLRAVTAEQMPDISDEYIIKKWYNEASPMLSEVDGRWFLNPAYEEVRKLAADGVKEIISNYKVDGIHIDDYFYPTVQESFDAAAYAQSGAADLSSWRLENINLMVAGIYSSIKELNQNVLFGISPVGNADSNYNQRYADVRKWGSEQGYCDYIVPQIYYGFSHAVCPFEQTAAEWRSIVTNENVKLVIGICTYKIGEEDAWAGDIGLSEWIDYSDVASRQVEWILNSDDYGSLGIFSYSSTFYEPKEHILSPQRDAIREMLVDQ